MKYELDTLPVWEAYEAESECPLCFLANKMEKNNVKFFLGGSVMQPVIRKQVNEKGFCEKHFQKLFKEGQKLTVAILANSRLLELKALMGKNQQKLLQNLKAKDFKKKISAYEELLTKESESCALCDKTERALKRYAFTILYLWKKKEDFRKTFSESRGFCYTHLPLLLSMAREKLSGKHQASFLQELFTLQDKATTRLEEEIDWFIQKFDYRNQDAPWKSSKDAPGRLIQKLEGFIPE